MSTASCIFATILNLWIQSLQAEHARWEAKKQARAITTPLEPLRVIDLSKSNDAANLGEPDSTHGNPYDMPDDWFFDADCRVIIKLPRGRTIDSPASGVWAQVEHGKVVHLSFSASPRRMCADDVRAVMVRNFEHLRVGRGDDGSGGMRILDKYLNEALAGRYATAQNFGSRDGDPSVDIRLSGNDDERGFELSYSVYWPH